MTNRDRLTLIASVFEAASTRIAQKNGTPEFEPGAWKSVTDSLLMLMKKKPSEPSSQSNDPQNETFLTELCPAFQDVLVPQFCSVEIVDFVPQVIVNLVESNRFPSTAESLLVTEIIKMRAELNEILHKKPHGGLALKLWISYFYGMCKQMGLPYERIAGECNRIIRSIQDQVDWIYVERDTIFFRDSKQFNPSILTRSNLTHSRVKHMRNGIFMAKKRYVYTAEDGTFFSSGFKNYKNSY